MNRYLECECGFTTSNESNQGLGIFNAHQDTCQIHKEEVKDFCKDMYKE